MSVDLEREPNYDAVVEKLIETTRGGKVQWQETADPEVYIAAVKGVQTFQLERKVETYPSLTLIPRPGSSSAEARASTPRFTLTAKDQYGKILFEHSAGPSSALNELFSIVQRIASGIDEKVDKSLELLKSL